MPSTNPRTGRVLKAEESINSNCPWSGEPIDADSLTLYKGNVVGFCNKSCRDAFAKSLAFFEKEFPQKKPSDIAEAVMFFEEALRNREHKISVEEAMSRLPSPEGKRFATVFAHGSLSVEIYAPRQNDPQQPHTRDEVYVVVQGSGEFINGKSCQAFSPGDFLFVPVGVEHRFVNFSDNLIVWVMFYGPEGGEASAI